MERVLEFLLTQGVMLVALFYGVTFLVALAQQNATVGRVMDSMAANPTLGMSNVYAAIGGAITPFCSCSTVPVLSSMLRTGIRFGVCLTFLMASPLVNEALIVVMWRYFGIEYMLMFIAAALTIPVVVGIVYDLLGLAVHIRPESLKSYAIAGGGGLDDLAAPGMQEVSFQTKARFAAGIAKNEIISVFPYLLIGLIIGGLIYGFVPEGWIQNLSNNYSELTLILIMAALGVPFYFNIVLVLPVAFALTEKGLGLGPITAFLVAGAGTSLPEMILLLKLFKVKLLIWYVGAMVVTAVIMGYMFSLVM